MDEMRPTEVKGSFELFLRHAQLRPLHVEPHQVFYCDSKKKPHNLSYNYLVKLLMPNARNEFCDSVDQWILFCSSCLLSYGRQRDFYMLLNCVHAEKSIIQLPCVSHEDRKSVVQPLLLFLCNVYVYTFIIENKD